MLSVKTDGSYRPAFETISVRSVDVEGQIQIEASGGPLRSSKAHVRSKIESVPHRCSNSMKDVIHETSLAMVWPQ